MLYYACVLFAVLYAALCGRVLCVTIAPVYHAVLFGFSALFNWPVYYAAYYSAIVSGLCTLMYYAVLLSLYTTQL